MYFGNKEKNEITLVRFELIRVFVQNLGGQRGVWVGTFPSNSDLSLELAPFLEQVLSVLINTQELYVDLLYELEA